MWRGLGSGFMGLEGLGFYRHHAAAYAKASAIAAMSSHRGGSEGVVNTERGRTERDGLGIGMGFGSGSGSGSGASAARRRLMVGRKTWFGFGFGLGSGLGLGLGQGFSSSLVFVATS